MDENQNTNQLSAYRRRMQYSQKRVASLLVLSDSATLSRYEQGHLLPSLSTALRLSAIYRVPVEFLFQGLYVKIREEVRATEMALPSGPRQGLLF
jgi:transcriptional regulator with XRE-family HTH domain